MTMFDSHPGHFRERAGVSRLSVAVVHSFELIGRIVAAAKAYRDERRANVQASFPDQESLQAGIDRSHDPVRDARRFPLAPVMLGEKWDF